MDMINSELCEIDGETLIYFKTPKRLLDSILEALETIGAEKLFSSPDEKTKKLRENIPELFFTLALQKETKEDIFILQHQEDPPDFTIMQVKDNPIEIILDQFELVEIPPGFEVFEEVKKVVDKKMNMAYPPSYNLLVFINNAKSKQWVNELNNHLNTTGPFKAIWTVHILGERGNFSNIQSSVVNRIQPKPVWHIEGRFSDTKLNYSKKIPSYMDLHNVGGKQYIRLKDSFVKELRKDLRKLKNK